MLQDCGWAADGLDTVTHIDGAIDLANVVRAVLQAIREPDLETAKAARALGRSVAIMSDRPGFTTTATIHQCGAQSVFTAIIDQMLKD